MALFEKGGPYFLNIIVCLDLARSDQAFGSGWLHILRVGLDFSFSGLYRPGFETWAYGIQRQKAGNKLGMNKHSNNEQHMDGWIALMNRIG